MLLLYPIYILLCLSKLAISQGGGEKEHHHQHLGNGQAGGEENVEKIAETSLDKIHQLIGEGGGHLKEGILDPGTGHELFRNLCTLRTTGNSKNVKEDEKKGIFNIDVKHQIRIEHGQIDDQLNEEINSKLTEICGPNVSKELLSELPKYITRIIEERKGAISGHFEHVKIVYYEKNKPIHTVDLKTILAKGMQKVDKLMPQLSKAFNQLRQILKSIGDVDGSPKQMITKLTTKEKWPPMPSELWEMCADLWEDFHSNSNHKGNSETHKTNNAHRHEKKVGHLFMAQKAVQAFRRRRKREFGFEFFKSQKHLLLFGSAFGLFLMPRIFSIGAFFSSPFGSAVAESDMSDISYFGQLFRVGTGSVLLVSLYAGYVMYGHDRFFPQHGQQEQQQEGEGGNQHVGGGYANLMDPQPPAN